MSTAVLTRSSLPPISWTLILLVLGLVGSVVAGGYVISQLQAHGHAAFHGDSRGLFWTLPIVTYDYFVLATTGLVMIASLWTVFGLSAFAPIARRALVLAVASLGGAVVALFMELGYPVRALLLIPFSFTWSAPLFWKVWGIIILSAALVVLFLTWIFPGKDERPALPAALVAFGAAIFVAVVAGGVYGWMSMRPVWYGGHTSIAFLVEGLLTGSALLVLFSWIIYGFRGEQAGRGDTPAFGEPFRLLLVVLVAAHGILQLSRLVSGLYSNLDGMEVWHHLWGEPLFHAELWLGLGVPLALLLLPQTRHEAYALPLAAAVVLLAAFLSRYHFVIGGQMVPLFKGSWAPDLLHYTPSLAEYAVLVTSVSVMAAIFAALQLLLRSSGSLSAQS